MMVLKDVCKEFHQERVLDEINFEVKKGTVFFIKGESGSGKSTLLHIIAALMKPTSGYVSIDGINISQLTDTHLATYRANQIGYITQNFYLLEELNVIQNLEAALVLHNLQPLQQKQKIEQALKAANIWHKRDAEVATLSGGEKQRCVIARAIVHQPDILVCDEPTANLDKGNGEFFKEIVRSFKEQNKIVILATHDSFLSDLEDEGIVLGENVLK